MLPPGMYLQTQNAENKEPHLPCCLRKNPTKREWQHWIVSNIPGSNIHQGTTLCEYIGAGPPKGSGLHRYVFLLFKQPQGKIELKEEKRLSNRTGQGRGGWSARAFARKYGLGDPIAANWYEAEWDHSVDKLYERLSGK
ncbi:Phosphatidylethanolamine-binding protein like protein F40A3.3 [Balamuthia mandrillaris]